MNPQSPILNPQSTMRESPVPRSALRVPRSEEQLELAPRPDAPPETLHPPLPIPEIADDDPNIDFLVQLLQGRDWLTARQIIADVCTRTAVTWCDRKVRALARASRGRIAGGQKGYKLVSEMTSEEYQHYRNWMLSQSDEMKQRVLDSDKIFYPRKPAA